ncbi:MAG TPA: GspH/FimT family pseudopilin [Planctomycetota bacterium]|nr:GspH/FimT family pseudopilin [Planctomycetota bacterium]
MRGPARPGTSGVALVELVLVMVIVLILAALIAPRFSDFFPALQVRSAASGLLAWTAKARAEAALTGARHRLVVDPEGRRFWIDFEPKPLTEPGTFVPLGGSWGEETLPGDVAFEKLDGLQPDPDSAARKVLEFEPGGTPAKAATLTVANGQGDGRTVRVEAGTGTVSILETEAQP